MSDNSMRGVVLEKVTLNIGVGASGQPLENAKSLLERLTGRRPVATRARTRNPVFKIKKGEAIGAKVTLRGRAALDFLNKALDAVDYKVAEKSFDERGNFSFGVKEYIDFPGARYDPKLGMLGFDVCVTLGRKGHRVARKRRARSRVGREHLLSREEGLAYARSVLKVSTA